MGQIIEEGSTISGKYCVERVLGRGGMGGVVRARHLQLEQQVAIKFLLPEKALSGDAVGRFLREARASVRLKSEHVARTLDVGTLEEGAPYMVMEYLEGHDLQDAISTQGTLPVRVAVEYLLQTCEGLAEAHQAGIVHRDLKPANLFLTTRSDGSPCVKILDFGISKVTQEASSHSMTQTSTILGTPYYMSPEQLRSSRTVDPRSDLWSLGIILHEMLTGRVAFPCESLPELCAAILTDPLPSPRLLRPDLPSDLEMILEKCLEKDPEARYQDVAELGRALAQFHPEGDAVAGRIARTLRRETSGSHPAARPSRPTYSKEASTAIMEVPDTLDAPAPVLESAPLLPLGSAESAPAPRRGPLVFFGVFLAAALVALALRFGSTAAPSPEAGTPGSSPSAGAPAASGVASAQIAPEPAASVALAGTADPSVPAAPLSSAALPRVAPVEPSASSKSGASMRPATPLPSPGHKPAAKPGTSPRPLDFGSRQ
jgi:serine/threonine protein kinase